MAKYLSIVKTAYRATVEEQDDTALWFTHAMKNGGAEVAVLLVGDAVNYAVKGQDAKGLSFGARAIKGPDIAHDVRALIGKNVSVMVSAEHAQERGITPADLIEGVEQVSGNGLLKLIDGYDRVLKW
jgi:sulfur relay (sulfurtransferase) DsrF/TusC family protein